MKQWQKEVNSKWFKQLRGMLNEGGTWVWPATGFSYRLKGGVFVGDTEEADDALRDILPEHDPSIVDLRAKTSWYSDDDTRG